MVASVPATSGYSSALREAERAFAVATRQQRNIDANQALLLRAIVQCSHCAEVESDEKQRSPEASVGRDGQVRRPVLLLQILRVRRRRERLRVRAVEQQREQRHAAAHGRQRLLRARGEHHAHVAAVRHHVELHLARGGRLAAGDGAEDALVCGERGRNEAPRRKGEWVSGEWGCSMCKLTC